MLSSVVAENVTKSMGMCVLWQQARKDSSVSGPERAEIYRSGVSIV